MKELMNIILNRSVNGYDFPWWVQIVSAINPSSQNSTYATNEMDDAQLSRFLKIKVDANLDDWVDYALDKHLNSDVIEAIAVSETIFNHKEKSQEDESEMYPDPRAWEMVCHLFDTIFSINETRYFSGEEKSLVNDDLRVLVRGKVGDTAARTLFENISNKENNIKPAEILTGKQLNIDPEIVTKFNNQKRLTQKIISDNVVMYVADRIFEIDPYKTSKDEKKKAYYMNFMSQLKEFAAMLDTATQIIFVKKFIKLPNGAKIFGMVSKTFSTTIIQNLYNAKDTLNDALSDNK